MSELKTLQRFHKCVLPEGDAAKLYEELVDSEHNEFVDEVGSEKVKEAVDVIVVAAGYLNAVGIDIERALALVNENNFSKLCLVSEVQESLDFYRDKGVDVFEKEVDNGLFGIYSAKDQTVDGYKYEKNKLLKPKHYKKLNSGELVAMSLLHL